MEATLIFPHQLFKQHPALQHGRKIFLIEEWLFFEQFRFHQIKLVLHRASMQFYKHYLAQQGYEVEYVPATAPYCKVGKLINWLVEKKYTAIHVADVADNWLQQRLQRACAANAIQIKKYDSPAFLNTVEEGRNFFADKKRYFQTDFYVWQRKKWNLLLDEQQKPQGGKWTYDTDNRSKLPANIYVPMVALPKYNSYVSEAIEYVQTNYADNLGSLNAIFSNKSGFYPTTFAEAEDWLEKFLEERFLHFGIYEDAMAVGVPVLFHSVLTPMLNIGLLTPRQILDATLAFAEKNAIPLNSLEGFVRQITGWREFIRMVYALEGGKQRTTNYWKFKRKIPASFYTGTTGIVPVDDCIKKCLNNAYNHHIERLMVLGNFMLLCEFDPDEVYKWFMEMYVDAYDWVMVPNVYGMTQFADGGLMTTKPYISGSNYIMKMSNYAKGSWQAVWDGLFWRFMHVHRNFFLQNPRLGMLVKTFDKMKAETRQLHLENAENFLQSLDATIAFE